MKKIKHEAELIKKALVVAEIYAKKQGYRIDASASSKDKSEALYRLLVKDKLIQPLPVDQENGLNMRHKLAVWLSHQLPADHPLLN